MTLDFIFNDSLTSISSLQDDTQSLSNSVNSVNSVNEHEEPLLNDERVNLFPIKYPDIYDMYQKQKASFWVPEEVDLSQDVVEWDQLDKNEQHFLLMVFAFFAGSDLIVNENLDSSFTEQIKVPEAKKYQISLS